MNFKRITYLASLMLLVAATAFGQQTATSTSTDTKSSAAKKAPKDVAKHQPKKNIRILTFKDKKKAQEVRAKAIRSIKELLDSEKDPGKRYELLRRYGEQYAEQAEYALEKEMIVYDEQYKQWERSKKGEAPKLDNTMSDLSLKKAVSIYKEIIAKYPTNAGVDVTYYELGKNMLRLNDKSGVIYLIKLLKEQPKSPYVPEALFALGEFYFEEHDMIEARKYYNEAAKHKEHTIYPYAVYKLGWTYYNFPANTPEEEQEKYKKAITAFKLVVKLAGVMKIEEDRAIYLRQEAINDLIMVWADTEDVDSAWTYFKQIGDQDAFYRMLERLGEIYVDQGKREDAIKVYERILREVPARPSNADNHAKLLDIFAEAMKFDDVVRHANLMTKLYLGEGTWVKANAKDKALVAEAEKTVEARLHKHATAFHKEAQKRKYPDLYKTAARLYLTYLENFPKNEKAYELRFFLADTLFELKRFEDATNQYLLVVKANEKDGKYLQESAMNAVIAMNTVVGAKKFPEIPAAGKVSKPLPIPKEKKKLQEVLDLYARLFPKKEDTRAMTVTAAKISFDYGHYADAIERFKTIAMTYPKTKQGDESARAVLSFYKERKAWDDVIKYAKLFLDTKGVLVGELRVDTQKLLVFASFERALEFDKANKPLEAATAFLQFQKDFPTEKNASVALYNAMVIYFKQGMVDNAVDSAKVILKEYPAFDRKSDVIMTLAETLERLGDYKNAAIYYASFAKQWPKDARAAQSLFSAGILAKGAGDDAAAVTYLTSFLAQFPANKVELNANLELAEALERQKQIPEAMKVFQTILDRFKNSGDDAAYAWAKIAQLKRTNDAPFGDIKDMWTIQKWLAGKGAPEAEKARKIVSAALFANSDKAFKAFVETKIDNKNLEVALQQKQAELVKLARTYQGIIALRDGEHIVAATYRLGQAHEAFAINIAQTEAPANLDANTRKEVAATLQQISEPLKKEALGFYKAAYTATSNQKVFTVWGMRAYDRMAQIDAKIVPKVDELVVDPGYVTHKIEYDRSVATALH